MAPLGKQTGPAHRLGGFRPELADPLDDRNGFAGGGNFPLDDLAAGALAAARAEGSVRGLPQDGVANLRRVRSDRASLSILSLRKLLQHLHQSVCRGIPPPESFAARKLSL